MTSSEPLVDSVLARWLRWLVRGFVSGAIILGLGGRIAMVAFSLILGLAPGITIRGTGVVALTGALYGLAGAAVLALLDRYARLEGVPRTMLGGTILYVIIAAVSIPNNQAGAALAHPVLGVVLFLPLAIGFAAAMPSRR